MITANKTFDPMVAYKNLNFDYMFKQDIDCLVNRILEEQKNTKELVTNFLKDNIFERVVKKSSYKNSSKSNLEFSEFASDSTVDQMIGMGDAGAFCSEIYSLMLPNKLKEKVILKTPIKKTMDSALFKRLKSKFGFK